MKLIGDVDTGIDDALTLFYLAHAQRQGEVKLRGVTTVGGNVQVALEVDAPRFRAELLESLVAWAQSG